MLKSIEPYLYIAAFAALGAMLVAEGARASSLEAARPVSPEELYQLLATAKVKPQVLDVRPEVEDNYRYEHIMKSIPFPGCDLAETPEKAAEMIERSIPTIIVSAEGDETIFEACRAQFTLARNLDGGFEALLDSDQGLMLVTESGEYEPPSTSAGGGCL